MGSIQKYVIFVLASGSTVYTIYIMNCLIYFLSSPRKPPRIYVWLFNILDNKSRLEAAYGPIVFNTLYLILFIMQHSFMKSQWMKKLLLALHLQSAERAIYSFCSSLCLHILMKKWSVANSILLWQWDVESNMYKWWLFVIVHVLSWIVICGGSIMGDLFEILGLRQAFFNIKNPGWPSRYKSSEPRTYYNHVRHPSFIAFTLILWLNNLMTIDRLLLAFMLTLYMYFSWSTDVNDMSFQKTTLKRKKFELLN